MVGTARAIGMMWLQRWRALREDRGASTIEYIILVVVGIAVAGLTAAAVTTAVKNHNKDIK